MEDYEIIELMENRSEKSIADLSKKYGGICAAVVRNILGDFTEVEQCLNDTYLKVWNLIPPAKPASLSAFVVKIARNSAISQLREKRSAKRGGGTKTLSFDELGAAAKTKAALICRQIPESRRSNPQAPRLF